jgi:hypothetical protein
MKISLPALVTFLLFVWINPAIGSANKKSPDPSFFLSGNSSLPYDSLIGKDKDRLNHSSKICVCEVLGLQSANHRVRNYALFAERTNLKNLSYDIHKAKWILEKEKRHLADFFYDKMDVIDDVVEITDSRSLFTKMKKNHKTLILYDILNADVKR